MCVDVDATVITLGLEESVRSVEVGGDMECSAVELKLSGVNGWKERRVVVVVVSVSRHPKTSNP